MIYAVAPFLIPAVKGCGKPNCRCHKPGEPVHGPNPRLTFKVQGKTVTESLPTPAAFKKAEREIAEFVPLSSSSVSSSRSMPRSVVRSASGSRPTSLKKNRHSDLRKKPLRP